MAQTFIGTVVRVSENLAKVIVERPVLHSRVHKLVWNLRGFDCLNHKGEVGDVVRIKSIPKLGPTIFFQVKEIIKPALTWTDPETNEKKVFLRSVMLQQNTEFGEPPQPRQKINGNRKRKHMVSIGQRLRAFGEINVY